jgi:hypothetical protein
MGSRLDSRLDSLAMRLAEPMSRRRALTLAGATAVTTLFGARADAAQAACPSCPQGGDPPDWTQNCNVARGVGCIFVCCPDSYKCCTSPTGVVCCQEGFTCGPSNRFGQPTCVCANPCGSACCQAGEKCANATTGLCCQIACGATCCSSGQKCVDPKRGVCCDANDSPCYGKHTTHCCGPQERCCPGSLITQCCGAGQMCTPEGSCDCRPGYPTDCFNECCRKNEKCCMGTSQGKGFCVAQNNECCGDSYTFPGEECCAGLFPYNPRSSRCCGISGVCPSNTECCPDGCCPIGSSCCEHGCCTTTVTGAIRVSPLRPFLRVRDRRTAQREPEGRRVHGSAHSPPKR